MKSAIHVLQEQIDNFYLVRRLSLYDLKSQNKNNYLGMLWEVLNPMTQILIYWFVFGTLRKRAPIYFDGLEVTFITWLMVGFLVWIFFYQSTIESSKSIYTRLRMLSKMNFPMSLIPNITIFSKLYVHLFMLLVATIIFQFSGHLITIYYFQIFYFIFGTYCLLFSIALITSTLSTIIRDVHLFLNSTLRMMLYISGVLWPISMLADWPIILKLMKLNPLMYLIDGYRTAFYGTGWYFLEHWKYSLYFWGVVIVLFIIGSYIHVRFRRNFIDYL